VEYERAIMAVRFSDEMIGTQFHPEADPYGMKMYFDDEENRKVVINNYSQKKYEKMMAGLEQPEKLEATHKALIPGFLHHALEQLSVDNLNTV
jgi:hypothetical protein